ncbi:hypothetical protein EJB05_03853, partial [Eragrostis curvula]
MAKKKSRRDATEPAAAQPRKPAKTRKRKRGANAAASCDSGLCDDVMPNIFVRLPARTLVASMALSKHHRRMILCPEFRSLHCRLGPPLPQLHIAYIAMANIRRRGKQKDPISGFHGFHVAGVGLNNNAPMRSLASGPKYLDMRYVNTCNGVVLLAGKPGTTTCVLWNPAVADEAKEVTVPVSVNDDCVILGLGCGRRSQSYKLLVSRRQKRSEWLHRRPPITRWPKQLLVYGGLGGGTERPPVLRTVLSAGVDGEISRRSLHINGVIYLLHVKMSAILAFDVDDETVTTIESPSVHVMSNQTQWAFHGCEVEMVTTVDNLSQSMCTLMEISGRPCVETYNGKSRTLWLLTEDHKWEQRCVIKDPCLFYHDFSRCSIAGVWDCGGVLFLYLHHSAAHHDHWLYTVDNDSSTRVLETNLPRHMTPEWSDYAFCWGYKPTLLSPGSIVGKQDEDSRRTEVLKPVNERERRKWLGATLDTARFMEFLVGIMQNAERDD